MGPKRFLDSAMGRLLGRAEADVVKTAMSRQSCKQPTICDIFTKGLIRKGQPKIGSMDRKAHTSASMLT